MIDYNQSSDSASSDSADRPEDQVTNRADGKRRGEPAPDITPEQFQRLMEEGSINVDGRGRVRSTRTGSAREGMSLRKRRAWYVG